MFYWAILTLYFLISHIVHNADFWQVLIFAYFLVLINIFLLIKAGWDLYNKKRVGIIFYLIFIVFSLITPVRPVFVDGFSHVADGVNIIIALYLLSQWKDFATKNR